jgi:Ser-tRNA(Ala) deacylase AlaX
MDYGNMTQGLPYWQVFPCKGTHVQRIYDIMDIAGNKIDFKQLAKTFIDKKNKS